MNAEGRPWEVGIRNPFNIDEIIKVVRIFRPSCRYIGYLYSGQHIYNPHNDAIIDSIKSLTVIGPNIYEADRFATAAFAMGDQGIDFIERTNGLEGYLVDKNKIATYTSGFERYTA